jgi:hypothetical protein
MTTSTLPYSKPTATTLPNTLAAIGGRLMTGQPFTDPLSLRPRLNIQKDR